MKLMSTVYLFVLLTTPITIFGENNKKQAKANERRSKRSKFQRDSRGGGERKKGRKEKKVKINDKKETVKKKRKRKEKKEKQRVNKPIKQEKIQKRKKKIQKKDPKDFSKRPKEGRPPNAAATSLPTAAEPSKGWKKEKGENVAVEQETKWI